MEPTVLCSPRVVRRSAFVLNPPAMLSAAIDPLKCEALPTTEERDKALQRMLDNHETDSATGGAPVSCGPLQAADLGYAGGRKLGLRSAADSRVAFGTGSRRAVLKFECRRRGCSSCSHLNYNFFEIAPGTSQATKGTQHPPTSTGENFSVAYEPYFLQGGAYEVEEENYRPMQCVCRVRYYMEGDTLKRMPNCFDPTEYAARARPKSDGECARRTQAPAREVRCGQVAVEVSHARTGSLLAALRYTEAEQRVMDFVSRYREAPKRVAYVEHHRVLGRVAVVERLLCTPETTYDTAPGAPSTQSPGEPRCKLLFEIKLESPYAGEHHKFVRKLRIYEFEPGGIEIELSAWSVHGKGMMSVDKEQTYAFGEGKKTAWLSAWHHQLQLQREDAERLERLPLDGVTPEALRACLSVEMGRPDEAAARVVVGLRNQALAMGSSGKRDKPGAREKRIYGDVDKDGKMTSKGLATVYPEATQMMLSRAPIASLPAARLSEIGAGAQHVHGGFTPQGLYNGGELRHLVIARSYTDAGTRDLALPPPHMPRLATQHACAAATTPLRVPHVC